MKSARDDKIPRISNVAIGANQVCRMTHLAAGIRGLDKLFSFFAPIRFHSPLSYLNHILQSELYGTPYAISR